MNSLRVHHLAERGRGTREGEFFLHLSTVTPPPSRGPGEDVCPVPARAAVSVYAKCVPYRGSTTRGRQIERLVTLFKSLFYHRPLVRFSGIARGRRNWRLCLLFSKRTLQYVPHCGSLRVL